MEEAGEGRENRGWREGREGQNRREGQDWKGGEERERGMEYAGPRCAAHFGIAAAVQWVCPRAEQRGGGVGLAVLAGEVQRCRPGHVGTVHVGSHLSDE